jgi:hypothetical protein
MSSVRTARDKRLYSAYFGEDPVVKEHESKCMTDGLTNIPWVAILQNVGKAVGRKWRVTGARMFISYSIDG